MTLKASSSPSRTDIAFAARDSTGKWWNGTAFEVFNVANFATYQITATETPADSGLYEGVEPTGTVEFELRIKSGTWAASYVVAGPQETDTAAEIVAAINADATQAQAREDARKARQFITNTRVRSVLEPTRIRYTVRNDNDTNDEFQVDYDPKTGNTTSVP